MERTSLTDLSPTELLATLDSAWTAGNRALARMLAYLGEVERRGLHVDMSCSSMFVFVERRFGLTGGSAFRRLTAARLVRRLPTIMSRIERGDIHLEALCALRDVLTVENVDDLMARTAKKTLREVEAIVACLAPRPDVKGTIRKMPERKMPEPTQASVVPPPTLEPEGSLFAVSRAAVSPPAMAASTAEPVVAHVSPPITRAPAVAPIVIAAPPPAVVAKPDVVVAPRAEVPHPRMQQLSEARHEVQLTVSSETRAKIERAQQCTHVDEHGNRCGCRDFLELDHIIPRAKGGTDAASNLRIVCRAHNQRYAKQAFGEEYVTRHIEASRARRRQHPRDRDAP